jgi:hypothetical protein
MIDLPTRARVLRAENGLWVRALQRADHEAGALSSGGADAGVAPTSTNGRSCLASGSHVGHGATYRGLTLRPSCDVQRRCTVTSAGRAARQPSWRSRVARLFWIRRGTLCDAESNAAFGLGCCRSCPGGGGRSALHIGRCEGDAVWHQRSDRRLPPYGNGRQLGGARAQSTSHPRRHAGCPRPSRNRSRPSCARRAHRLNERRDGPPFEPIVLTAIETTRGSPA